MAEIKNTFLKSKMNKDLDDRLIPNGEYRDAQNISVGKSEDADVGALENIIGNANVTSILPYDSSCEIIGYFSDARNNRIITFVTNYTDQDPASPTYVSDFNVTNPSPIKECHICVYDQNNPNYQKVVSGEFLNFSTTNKVLGISLIEDLLFFTDNRNQPRKINISTAINDPSYYVTEDTISVAKYNPYEPISLLKKVEQKTTAAASGVDSLSLDDASNVEVGMIVAAKNLDQTAAISGSDFVTVGGKSGNTVTLVTQVGATTVPVQYLATVSDDANVTFLKSTMTKEDSSTGWPGDPDLLEEKFVRFSYRFKFDDGEYSLMAPFTQIAYVPKQKGYFQEGDEAAAYKSTILDFMENDMNNMELLIPLPSKGVDIESQYKITSIDVLYKESDALTVKVLESLSIGSIPSTGLQTNIYSYQYQSRKPYKTLPQFETTRVYDKVPVRALSQETSGNRVMYGNFYDRYSSLESIDYYVGAFAKNTENFDSWVEYPNHSIKQNRNYQVGFILSDKFGRQTPVILSPVDLSGLDAGTTQFKGGSTVYRPYYDGSTQPDIQQWFGDAIQLVIQNKLSSGINDKNTLSEAGLYAVQYQDPSFSGIGFSISTSSFSSTFQTQLLFALDATHASNASVPRAGDYLRGEYRDYVKVTSTSLNAGTYTVNADGAISSSYLHKDFLPNDIKFAYTINQIGWYSYKVVVKQTEQEYYNVYSAGAMKGLPYNYDSAAISPILNEDTSFITLLGDNINKIPRDLAEVGPQDKSFRSSVGLYGRVQNHNGDNSQFFPSRTTFNTTSIEDLFTLFDISNFTNSFDNPIPITNPLNAFHGFFKSESDPFVAEISTSKSSNLQFGANNSVLTQTGTALASANVTNSVTLPIKTVVGTIEIGSIITEIAGVPLTGTVDYVVTNTTGDSTPTLTLNREITLSNNDALTFSLETYKDIATLAVLETPPVESLLDIFWETTTTGLISDLNEDILTGSDAPVGLTSLGFIYKENQNPNGTGTGTGDTNSPYITDAFFPLSPEGVSLQNTLLSSFTVTDNNSPANDVSSFFDVIQETTPGATFGSYRFKLNSNSYNYFSNTFATSGSYNFSISVKDINGDIVALPFTGSLTNIDPYISIVTPPTMTPGSSPLSLITLQSVDNSSASLQIGSVGTIVNGSYRINEAVNQVGVFFTSVPPVPVSNIQNSVTINHETGSAFRGYDWAEGYYDFNVEVKDALVSFSSGQRGISSQPTESNGTATSINYEQPIRIVPGACNLDTGCQFDPGSGTRDQTFPVQVPGGRTFKDYGWRFGSTNGGNPAGFVAETGNVSTLSSDGLKRGTVLFDLMVESEKDTVDLRGYFKWRIWYRSNSSNAWSINNVIDTNGVDLNTSNGEVSNGTGWIQPGASNDFSCLSGTSGTVSQIHIPVALSRKGEYFIQVRGYKDVNSGSVSTWINATDANYPTCVPVKSTNMISGTGRDADWFQYNLATTGNSDTSISCAASLTDTVYARTPYSHVAGQLFTTLDLTIGKTGIENLGEKYSYEYAPDVSNTFGADIATQYAAEFISDINNSVTGRTIRGVVKDITGIDRLPCNTSGTYQNLDVKVYYNENYL